MAAGSQGKIDFDKQTILYKLTDIFDAIDMGSLDKIEKFFTRFTEEQCTLILNSTIQCWSPLSYAIKKCRLEISQYLLEHSLRQGRWSMCDNWRKYHHPLSVALEIGNLEMIRLVARNTDDINEILPGCCTPLTKAINSGNLEYVKLMVRLGADVNLCLYGTSPLIESTFKSEICRYLIENDADIDQPDDKGYGALHAAVDGGHMDSIEILVEAGADVRLTGKDGITPLLLSAMRQNIKVFRYLKDLPAYSDLEKMDAMDVYNAYILLVGYSCLDYWYQTLEMREIPKLIWVPDTDLFSSAVEFSSIDELDGIKGQPLKLAYQVIFVLKRILGSSNSVYIRSLVGAALVAKDEGHLHELRDLLDYMQSFAKEVDNTACVLEVASFIRYLFTCILDDDDGNDEEAFFQKCALTLFEIVGDAIVEEWYSIRTDVYNDYYIENQHFKESIDVFLFMLNRIDYLPIPADERKEYDDVAEKVVECDPRVEYLQSLLHRVIRVGQRQKWATPELVEVLLEAGADPDSKDYFRQTPLMYALKHASDETVETTVCILLSEGAHRDCLSKEGFSAMDFSRWEMLLNVPNVPLSLECLATRVILNHRIPYSRVFKPDIVSLIDFHE